MQWYVRVYRFYRDGLRSMKLGKKLWLLVAVKILIIFTLVKLLFPDILHRKFSNDRQRSDYILQQLTQGAEHASH